jgi:hypothetical protein
MIKNGAAMESSVAAVYDRRIVGKNRLKQQNEIKWSQRLDLNQRRAITVRLRIERQGK